MKKEFIPYAFLLGCLLFMYLFEWTYAQTVIAFMYMPCVIFIKELWRKVKLTRDLIISSAAVMLFATGAQIIGLNRIWRVPEQELIIMDWVIAPIEEFGYWHAALCLGVLIYKHVKVYYVDLVNDISIWGHHFRGWVGRIIQKKNS